MSGLAGVFMRRTDAPAVRATVAAMGDAAPHRAVDGSWAWHAGSFSGIRQRTFCTPEDSYEQIAVETHGPTVMLFEGRLDNRDELAHSFDLSPAPLSGLSDAALALRAWVRWREQTPIKLLGDFALAVWDGPGEQVFCATDALGVRPFHYYLSDTTFVFATELKQLLAHPVVPCEPNERAVAEFLCTDPRASGQTLYRHLHRLPHAHALTVTKTDARLVRYWDPRHVTPLTFRDDAAYVERFREIFDRSVADRLRTAYPLGVHLSGGLDSSSVLVTAAGMAGPRGLSAVSLMFPGVPDADEHAYIDAVLRHRPMSAVQIEPPPFDPEAVRDQVRQRRYLPDFPNVLVASALRGAMAARGIRSSLTGSGGDLGLAGSYFHYADLLKRGQFVSFARRYREVARSPEHGWTSAEVLRGGLWPLLPSTLRRALRPLARRLVGMNVPSWIDPAFARRVGMLDLAPIAPPPNRHLAAATSAAAYDGGLMHAMLDLYELGSSAYGIYDRHPFLDRRVAEFAVALPDDLRWRNRQMKYVLRRAMAGRLPDAVRERSDHAKSDFSHLAIDALEGMGGRRFFERLTIADNGWVVRGALPHVYDRMRALRAAGNLQYRELTWQLWSAVAVECWYSIVFGAIPVRRESWKSVQTTREPGPSPAEAAPVGSRTPGPR